MINPSEMRNCRKCGKRCYGKLCKECNKIGHHGKVGRMKKKK